MIYNCPNCDEALDYESVHNGVCMLYGLASCTDPTCDWSDEVPYTFDEDDQPRAARDEAINTSAWHLFVDGLNWPQEEV